MGNCESYDAHVSGTRNTLRHPMDTRSLYRHRIYDNQTANRRSYESHPIEIVEGFGSSDLSLNTLLKWGIILVVIYLIFMMLTKSNGGLPNLMGGTESLSDLSFLNSE